MQKEPESRPHNLRSLPRPRFVSFSGVDGAGKSTQIDRLYARLKQAGLRVRVLRFWDDVARLTRLREGAGHKVFKGEKGIGSPEAPINRRDKNVRGWPMTLFRLFLYFVDALSVRRAVKDALRGTVDFVIFDRYIYDELANLELKNPLIRAYVRTVMKLVPRPDVSFVLDADPDAARARKPEYPVEFIRMNRVAYMDLGLLVGGLTIIPPMVIEAAEREVLRHTLAALASMTKPPASERNDVVNERNRARSRKARSAVL